jgi:hypothetical protein
MTEHKGKLTLTPLTEIEKFQELLKETNHTLAARLCHIELSLLPMLKEPFPDIPADASATDLRNALEACLVDIKTKRLILEGMLAKK